MLGAATHLPVLQWHETGKSGLNRPGEPFFIAPEFSLHGDQQTEAWIWCFLWCTGVHEAVSSADFLRFD